MPEAPSPSELNPLTNPVLEQNLSRWAKVYFSTPPAKRDQAVSDLLEEIRRESGMEGAALPARPYFVTDPKLAGPVCSACQHRNPPGHRFCSRCGQAVSPLQPGALENNGAFGIPQAPRPGEARQPNSAPNMLWLREQAFSGLDDSYSSSGRKWKYVAAAAVIVLAGLAYRQWVPQFRVEVGSSPRETAVPVATVAPAGSPAQDRRHSETVAAISGTREGRSPSTAAKERDRAVLPAGVQSAAQKSPLLDAANSRQTVAGQESGTPDLRLAQRYLGGSMGTRDPSEAAKLLWKAVARQNAAAAVLLSDLYARGDGVPRSCDQARLLLIAAAKRGSPQAAEQLHSLESRGCQ